MDLKKIKAKADKKRRKKIARKKKKKIKSLIS